MIDWGKRRESWLGWLLLIWLVACAVMLAVRWNGIHWFALGDTDDNMRISQVRALLAGQDWFDLRQYKLDPPGGADIHWSRFVDLPIAAIILVVKPFLGGVIAEKAAVALAPLVPLGVALVGMALTARRLIAPAAYPVAALLLLIGCTSSILMFMPLRIDHHGWQLALLVLNVAGLADPRAARGGLTIGLASAASLVIGIELILYLAIFGAAVTLRWIWDDGEALRLRAYGLALGGGTALGYLAFASYANRAAVCDALSPVWLSVMVLAGALLLLLLSFLRTPDWRVRLGAAGGAAIVVAVAFVLAWPDCVGRPERISPELKRLWLDNVREARPLYTHSIRIWLPTIALPAAGLIGSIWATWRARGTPAFGGWAPLTLVAAVSLALLLYQTRVGPAAQLLAVPGSAWLVWTLAPRLMGHRLMLVRTLGIAAMLLIVSGVGATLATRLLKLDPPTARMTTINQANARCPTLPSLRPVAQLPPATVLTFIDFGPRLITVTHHKAIAGPYHRNGNAMLDVIHAFDGKPEEARAIAKRHGATLLLICPNMSESTLYTSRSKKGFYARLIRGERFDWLTPVPLPRDSPLRLWRIS